MADPNHLGTEDSIGCSFAELPSTVKVGSKILLADGGLTCEVKKTDKNKVIVECLNDFTLGSRKNMILPGARVDIPVLSE